MPTSEWQPTLANVGGIIRARTKDTFGNEVGTFNADTRPTDQQAAELILQATRDVAMVVGNDIPGSTWLDARSVAAIRAAGKIELSFFPEQVSSGASPYPQLKQDYEDSIKRLVIAVQAAGGDTTGQEPGVPLEPSFSFPIVDTDPFIIGRGTPW